MVSHILFGKKYVINRTNAGLPLHWEGGNSLYSFGPSMISKGANYIAAVENAFNDWSELPQLNYDRGTDSQTDSWGVADGYNNITFLSEQDWETTGAGSSVVAVTRVQYFVPTGGFLGVDIAFNSTPRTSTGSVVEWAAPTTGSDNKLDVENVAA